MSQPEIDSRTPAVSVGTDLATTPAGAGGVQGTAGLAGSVGSTSSGARASAPQPQASSTAPASTTTSSPQSVEDAVAAINSRLASTNRVLQLSVDAAGITIAEIKNAATGQVLQQIPSNDLVRFAEMLSSWSHGDKALLDLIA